MDEDKFFFAAISTVVIVTTLCIGGFILNVVKLTRCDFEPSYKAEVIRAVGVFVPPVGVVVGYCDIEDKKQEE